jgi:DNA relaxase NicK
LRFRDGGEGEIVFGSIVLFAFYLRWVDTQQNRKTQQNHARLEGRTFECISKTQEKLPKQSSRCMSVKPIDISKTLLERNKLFLTEGLKVALDERLKYGILLFLYSLVEMKEN